MNIRFFFIFLTTCFSIQALHGFTIFKNNSHRTLDLSIAYKVDGKIATQEFTLCPHKTKDIHIAGKIYHIGAKTKKGSPTRTGVITQHLMPNHHDINQIEEFNLHLTPNNTTLQILPTL